MGPFAQTQRRVRIADVDPSARCRLDAIARYVQDIARDDSDDAGFGDSMGWVVRRTMIEVRQAPRFEERMKLATWCSGHGGSLAERRTEIRGEHGAEVDSVTLWVHIDRDTGRPRKLIDRFFEVWGETAAGRKVSARSSLDPEPAGASAERWSVRATDLDTVGHMNNAAHWAPVEEVLARHGVPARLRAELEHGAGVDLQQQAILHVRAENEALHTWVTADGALAIFGGKADVQIRTNLAVAA